MEKALPFRALKRAGTFVLGLMAAAVVPMHVAAQEDDWELDPFARVEVSGVSAKSTSEDDEYIINGDGLIIRTQAGVNFEDEDTHFRLEADRITVVRFGEGRRNTDRDRLTASVEQDLDDDWSVQLRVRHYDDLASAESSNTDSFDLAARVTYEPERAHRFRLITSWRDRNYDDGDGPAGASSKGEGPRVYGEYRRRFDRYHYLSVSARAESIDSDNPERNYARQSAGVAYTHPITYDLRVRPAVQVRQTRFSGRLINGEASKETYIAPELELHWWPDNWRMEAEAKYVHQTSNDPRRDREGYRLSLSVGYVF